jgi:hypothetical protein
MRNPQKMYNDWVAYEKVRSSQDAFGALTFEDRPVVIDTPDARKVLPEDKGIIFVPGDVWLAVEQTMINQYLESKKILERYLK